MFFCAMKLACYYCCMIDDSSMSFSLRGRHVFDSTVSANFAVNYEVGPNRDYSLRESKIPSGFFSHMHIPVRSGCLSCVNLWKLLNENIYPTFCAMKSIFQHK